MASAIENPIIKLKEFDNLEDAFQSLDQYSIRKLARVLGSYYRPLNRR